MNKDFFESKKGKNIVIGLIAVIAVLLVFRAGVGFGYRQALFEINWGKNYQKNFLGHDRVMPRMDGRDFMIAHGTDGMIVKIDLAQAPSSTSTLTVKEPNGTEKSVVINPITVIKRFMDSIKIEDLKVDEHITVIGTPDTNGQIEAKLIRVFPPEE